MAAALPPGDVLCLAEGEGRNAVHLAQLGHRVLAQDLSAVGLAKAEALAQSRGVTIQTCCGDLDASVATTAGPGVVPCCGGPAARRSPDPGGLHPQAAGAVRAAGAAMQVLGRKPL